MNSFQLHEAGTTGIPSTHRVIDVSEDGDGEVSAALELIISAIGATPTMTGTWEGSFDGNDWYPIAYLTDASDTLAVTAITKTTVDQFVFFLANPVARRYRKYRFRVTANTNVTFSSRLHLD